MTAHATRNALDMGSITATRCHAVLDIQSAQNAEGATAHALAIITAAPAMQTAQVIRWDGQNAT